MITIDLDSMFVKALPVNTPGSEGFVFLDWRMDLRKVYPEARNKVTVHHVEIRDKSMVVVYSVEEIKQEPESVPPEYRI